MSGDSCKWKKIWAICLLASFAYELPVLPISSFDKANLRLYDLVFIWGLLLFNVRLFRPLDNKILRIWGRLVLFMGFCVACYAFVMPLKYEVFSLYYLWKYIEGLATIRMFLLCKDYISFKTIRQIFILMGVFIAIYSLPQAISKEDFTVELAEGSLVTYPGGTIIGPYSTTYFALAQVVPVCSLFALHKFVSSPPTIRRAVDLSVWFFVSYPAVFCGSRTALALWLLSSVLFLIIKRKKKTLVAIVSLSFVLLFSLSLYKGEGMEELLIENNRTLSRSAEIEEGDASSSSLSGRVEMYKSFRLDNYDYAMLLPIIGSGFYVSPCDGRYRIGYGFHNNYVFAFEQTGVIGLLLFVYFLLLVLRMSYKNRDGRIAPIILAFTAALAVVSMTGQTFWRGFGNCNANSLIVLLMCLSIYKLKTE